MDKLVAYKENISVEIADGIGVDSNYRVCAGQEHIVGRQVYAVEIDGKTDFARTDNEYNHAVEPDSVAERFEI